MSKLSQITPAIYAEVALQHANKKSSREIAQFLLGKYNIQITHTRVCQLLKETKHERAEVTRSVIKEAMVPTIIEELKAIVSRKSRISARAEELWKSLSADEKKTNAINGYIKLVALEQRDSQMLLSAVGLQDNESEDKTQELNEEFLNKLNRLKIT